MPIQFPTFPWPTFQQSNPMLTGASAGIGLMGQGQDLYKAILANLFYPRVTESEIGLREAQKGHLGAETEKLRTLMKYLEPEEKLKLEKLEEERNQARLIQNYLNQRLELKTSPSTPTLNIPSINAPQTGTGLSLGQQPQSITQQTQRTPTGQATAPLQQPQPQGLSYFDLALLGSKYGLGFGSPTLKEIPGTGKIAAISPLGTVSVAEGPSPEELKFSQEMGKNRADKINQLGDILQTTTEKQDVFDELTDVTTNPTWQNIKQNPVLGKYKIGILEKTGTPEQKEAIGRFRTLTGKIISTASKDFKGQFRIGEQALLNKSKPTEEDSFETANGKMQALMTLNKLLHDRTKLTAQLMEKGYSYIKAQDEADKLIQGNDVRNSVRDLLLPKKTFYNKKTGEQMTVNEKEAKKLGIPWPK